MASSRGLEVSLKNGSTWNAYCLIQVEVIPAQMMRARMAGLMQRRFGAYLIV
jgi:hypothetical protein